VVGVPLHPSTAASPYHRCFSWRGPGPPIVPTILRWIEAFLSSFLLVFGLVSYATCSTKWSRNIFSSWHFLFFSSHFLSSNNEHQRAQFFQQFVVVVCPRVCPCVLLCVGLVLCVAVCFEVCFTGASLCCWLQRGGFGGSLSLWTGTWSVWKRESDTACY